MAVPSDDVLLDRPAPGVVRLLLNRPARRNAIDESLLAGLFAGLHAARDASAIVIGSTDARAFCAGVDLTVSDQMRARLSDSLYRLYGQMLAHPAVLIAALEGAAVGGGAQLAVACDLRVAAPSAWIRFVGPGHGLAVGAWALPSLIGRGSAVDLCLTGRRVEASEAATLGLFDRATDDVDGEALDLAMKIAGANRAATTLAKAIVTRGAGLREALKHEADGNRAWGGAVR